MREHDSVQDLLPAAAAGALDAKEQSRVDRHLRECGECRRKLEVWQVYSRELSRLPQPEVPARLMERTKARILQERAAITERRWEQLVLAALALFVWTVTLSGWLVMRIFTGGVLVIMGTNLMRLSTWFLASTMLMWVSAGAVALALGSRCREGGRV
jgi:anti-sigma factor RsiW